MMTEAMTARLKPVQPGTTTLVSVLDIGSTKICCVIARLTPKPESKSLKGRTHSAEVIGFGYGKSSGIKSGVITDLDKAEQAIRSVVGMAERAAGLTLESVIVNVTAGRLGSETFSASVSLGGQEVERADLSRVLRAVNERSIRSERSIIHALPIGYSLDGQKGVRDPLGMVGEKLGIVDQFQGVDELKVNADGSLEILERIDGGRHQISTCAGAPALLGWATGNLPEPKNNPQVGMANMRTIMPALQKAKPAQIGAEGITYHSVSLPKQARDTKVVKDLPPDQIAAEIVDWITNK